MHPWILLCLHSCVQWKRANTEKSSHCTQQGKVPEMLSLKLTAGICEVHFNLAPPLQPKLYLIP